MPQNDAAGKRVAVLGMGRMGASMARRLADLGFTVAVYNRHSDRARAVAGDIGATVVETPAAAARWSSAGGDGSTGVLLVSLADDAACRRVYLGDEGLVSGLSKGAVVADTSTIDPDTARELAAAVAAAGGEAPDSPVSGSVPAALAGGLTVMVGGNPAAVARARPVLEAIGKRVVSVGASGAGAVVKLGVNAVVHALNQALSESMVLVEKAGVEREVFYDVIAESAAAAPFVDYKRAAFIDPDGTPVAFALGLMGKDLRLITELAARVGAPMPSTTATYAATEQAAAAGFADGDMSVMAQYLRSMKDTVA